MADEPSPKEKVAWIALAVLLMLFEWFALYREHAKYKALFDENNRKLEQMKSGRE